MGDGNRITYGPQELRKLVRHIPPMDEHEQELQTGLLFAADELEKASEREEMYLAGVRIHEAEIERLRGLVQEILNDASDVDHPYYQSKLAGHE